MTKPKAQTLQQKLGFFDEDLKKPKHDELMLWLDNNIENIINKLFNPLYSIEQIQEIRNREAQKLKVILKGYHDHKLSVLKELQLSDSEKRNLHQQMQRTDEERQKVIDNIDRKIRLLNDFDINNPIPEKPRISRITKKWELPVATDSYRSKYTIGFIDYAVTFNIPVLELTGLKFYTNDITNKRDYYDIDETIFGFNYVPREKTLYVEVKTEISSLGELIRQINHYKSYLRGDYYVLCPDNKYKETLLEQGIGSLDYE